LREKPPGAESTLFPHVLRAVGRFIENVGDTIIQIRRNLGNYYRVRDSATSPIMKEPGWLKEKASRELG